MDPETLGCKRDLINRKSCEREAGVHKGKFGREGMGGGVVEVEPDLGQCMLLLSKWLTPPQHHRRPRQYGVRNLMHASQDCSMCLQQLYGCLANCYGLDAAAAFDYLDLVLSE